MPSHALHKEQLSGSQGRRTQPGSQALELCRLRAHALRKTLCRQQRLCGVPPFTAQGHYVPAVAHRVYRSNELGEGPYINLQGVAIGNGLTMPAIQVGAAHGVKALGLARLARRSSSSSSSGGACAFPLPALAS